MFYLNESYDNVIVLGDLNLPDIDWELYLDHSNATQDYADWLYDLNFSQLVTEPTHTGGNINVLDVNLTNTDTIHNVQVQKHLPCHLSSDH